MENKLLFFVFLFESGAGGCHGCADYRNHYSHGLNRLRFYLGEIEAGMVDLQNRQPTIVKESVATALVDGHNLSGPFTAMFCMDLAMKKAKETGIGWVSARGCNHFGIAGWYSMKASEQGLVGMAFTNTSPMMIPTRAKKPTLGTNAMSVAAPANGDDSFVLDMATTAVAYGKVQIRNRTGQTIPEGWAMDGEGKETQDGEAVRGLYPLGGKEQTGGYKGYGLAMMLEIFGAMLSGSNYGPNIRFWNPSNPENAGKGANLGQCFVAIDPSAFEDGFTDRLGDLMNICRQREPADGETEVLVAGDMERQHMEKCERLGGIPYPENQITEANEIAKQYKTEAMRPVFQ
ncbi:hypothetical protein ScPMuIL_016477 [Solemya velum]